LFSFCSIPRSFCCEVGNREEMLCSLLLCMWPHLLFIVSVGHATLSISHTYAHTPLGSKGSGCARTRTCSSQHVDHCHFGQRPVVDSRKCCGVNIGTKSRAHYHIKLLFTHVFFDYVSFTLDVTTSNFFPSLNSIARPCLTAEENFPLLMAACAFLLSCIGRACLGPKTTLNILA